MKSIRIKYCIRNGLLSLLVLTPAIPCAANQENSKFDRTPTISAELDVETSEASRERINDSAAGLDSVKITAVYGHVTISSDEGKSWTRAYEDVDTPMNSILRTGKRSRTLVTFADGSLIHLDELSKFKLSESEFDDVNDVRKAKIRVIKGNILAVIRPVKFTDGTFQLDAVKAQLTTEGGEFFVGVDDEGTTRVSAFHGSIRLKSRKKEIELNENFGSLIKRNKSPAKPGKLRPAPVITYPPDQNFLTFNQALVFEWDHIQLVTDKQEAGFLGRLYKRHATYYLEIARDSSFNHIVLNEVTKRNYSRTGLLPPGDYFWRISSIDQDQLRGRSSVPGKLRIMRDLNLKIVAKFPPLQDEDKWLIGSTNLINVVPVQKKSSVTLLEYSLNGGPFRECDGRIFFQSSGEYLLRARGIGADGYVGKVVEQRVKVDLIPPAIKGFVSDVSMDYDRNNVVFVTFDVTDESGVKSISYRIDDDLYRPYTGRIKLQVNKNFIGIPFSESGQSGEKRLTQEGSTKVDCLATDLVGNSAVETLSFTY